MSLASCKESLQQVYETNPNVARSASFWKKEAWGSTQSACESFFTQENEDILLYMRKVES